jgi:hypothetical protein
MITIMNNEKVTKKIQAGHYLHIRSGLHIVYTMGENTGYWNIWEDGDMTIEWMVSIPTKWQAIDKINTYLQNL